MINLNTDGHNLLLNSLNSVTVALYTGGNYATDEVSGGGYTRLDMAFDAANNASINASGDGVRFAVPGGITVTHAAWFVGALRIAEGTVSVPESFGGPGFFNYDGVLSLALPTPP